MYGDRPETGARSDDLTVRAMLAEAREFCERPDAPPHPFRLGVTSRLVGLPAWKREADFLFAQVAFSAPDILRWRQVLDFAGPVYAGVLVVASAPMARKLSMDIPELTVDESVITLIERDPRAGVDLACDLITEIRESDTFDGVHLIPVGRYREVAARLEPTRGLGR